MEMKRCEHQQMNRLSKRVLKTGMLLLMSLMFVFLAACGSSNGPNNAGNSGNSASRSPSDGGSAGSAGEEPKRVRVAAEAWMVEKLYVQQAVDKFAAENPDIEVELVPYADPTVLSNFAIQWSQGTTDADVVIIDGSSNAAQFLTKDLIYDFNELNFFEGETAREHFVGNSLSFGELNGVQFAIPISLETYAINANKKMFEAAGLTDENGEIILPKDWNEIYEYAKKMTIKEGDKVVQQGMTIQWGPNALYTLISTLKAETGSFYDENGVLTVDSPEIREILEIWKKGADEGVFSTDTFTNKDAGRNNYKADQVAMLFESGSRAPESAPTIGEENATVIPVPGMEENGSFAFAAGIVIPKASESPNLAVKFLREALMSEEIQVGMASDWGKLPVINKYYDLIDADWKDTLHAIIEKSETTPMYRDLPVIVKETPVELQKYLTGEQDLDSFFNNMQKLIDNANKEV